MTMISIGENVKSKKLALVTASGSNWKKYPVKITPTEMSTMKDQKHLMSVLEDTFKTPSQMAGIPASRIICPVIHIVDKEFRAARTDYMKKLALAEGDDLKRIKKLEEAHKVKSYGGWWGWIFKVLETLSFNYKSDEEVAREGSAHRIRWLYEVDTEESKRMTKIKTEVQKAITAVVADLEARKKSGVIDLDIMRKARQLSALWKAVFPTETNLDVEKMDKARALLPPKMAELLAAS